MKTVYGLSILLTVFMIFIVGLSNYGVEVAVSDKSNLNNDSILYIAEYVGFQDSNFNVDSLENDSDLFAAEDNSSGEPTVDFAQEFLFSFKNAQKSQQYVSTIVNLPAFMILTFNQEVSVWAEYLVIIGSFITITLIIAFYLFIKSRPTED